MFYPLYQQSTIPSHKLPMLLNTFLEVFDIWEKHKCSVHWPLIYRLGQTSLSFNQCHLHKFYMYWLEKTVNENSVALVSEYQFSSNWDYHFFMFAFFFLCKKDSWKSHLTPHHDKLSQERNLLNWFLKWNITLILHKSAHKILSWAICFERICLDCHDIYHNDPS